MKLTDEDSVLGNVSRYDSLTATFVLLLSRILNKLGFCQGSDFGLLLWSNIVYLLDFCLSDQVRNKNKLFMLDNPLGELLIVIISGK